jgi:hypothetical protein
LNLGRIVTPLRGSLIPCDEFVYVTIALISIADAAPTKDLITGMRIASFRGFE